MTSLRGAHLDPNQHNSCVTNNHYPQNSQFNRLTTAVSIPASTNRFSSRNFWSLSEGKDTGAPAATLEEHDKGQNSSQRAIVQREICAVSAHECFLIFLSTHLMLILRPFALSQWDHTEETTSCLHASVRTGRVLQQLLAVATLL